MSRGSDFLLIKTVRKAGFTYNGHTCYRTSYLCLTYTPGLKPTTMH